MHLIVSWLLSALSLWIVAQLLPSMKVRGFGSAMLATLVIAVVDGTVGWILRIVMFPLTLLTLGLFLLVINGILLKVASWFTPGFQVRGFLGAILGSALITLVNTILRYALR